MKQNELLIIADDFGMSEGVCQAITELAEQKKISGTSVMATASYFSRIVDLAKIRSNSEIQKITKKFDNDLGFALVQPLQIGLHLDFTFGKSLSNLQNHNLTNENGDFKQSFFGIFWRSFVFQKKLTRAVFRETLLQVKKLEEKIEKIDYIDGHQHIHSIPLIFAIVKKIAKKRGIKRVRIINEKFPSFFEILQIIKFRSLAGLISLVKLAVLRFCTFVNRNQSDYYFHSIVDSCRFDKNSREKLLKLLKKESKIELMIHPGYSKIDGLQPKNREFYHLRSEFRDIERETWF